MAMATGVQPSRPAIPSMWNLPRSSGRWPIRRARTSSISVTGELCTGDIAPLLGVTDSAVSQHLRVLRALRLIRSRRAGKFIYHSLDDEHVALLLSLGLTHLGHGDRAESLVVGHEVMA